MTDEKLLLKQGSGSGPIVPSIIRLAFVSFGNYLKMLATGSLHLKKDRLHHCYQLPGRDQFEVFRESISDLPSREAPAVLVVGFRLKLLRSSKVMHWLFQRVCILTTPFWSGFKGFGVKLWMVSPNHDYLGIYQWFGQAQAAVYVSALRSVLVPLSTPRSVWYDLHPRTGLDDFLAGLENSKRPAYGKN